VTINPLEGIFRVKSIFKKNHPSGPTLLEVEKYLRKDELKISSKSQWQKIRPNELVASTDFLDVSPDQILGKVDVQLYKSAFAIIFSSSSIFLLP